MNEKTKQWLAGQKTALTAVADLQVPKNKRVIWFHAASVGEFEQARPIIERLREEKARVYIVLTFFSPSGYEMRKNYDKADKVAYLPLPTRKNARAFLDAVQPSMAIFVKYEFWPAFLKELAARQIPTYSIAAIFRKNQLFFKPWGKWYLNLLKCFTRIYVQDEMSKQLLETHGINNIKIAGDTRFDRVSAIAAQAKKIPEVEAFVKGCSQVLVAGSTWPQDEALLAQYVEEHPEMKLVLVPHEIDETHLHTIFQQFEGRLVRFTQANRQNIDLTRVLVVDTMGLLSSIYRYATVSYIGGGFGVGIHNTIEAAVYGLPVLFGPNYSKFREAKGLIAAGAAKSVKDYKTLKEALEYSFEHAPEMGAAAKTYVAGELGATDIIYKDLYE